MNSKISLLGVKKIILISSGKGGVGKSTIAYYLAKSMASMGLKIGLIDADIYGPSIPVLTNKYDKPEIKNNNMIPHEVSGMKVNSIGYLVPKGKALIWRGPMITKALHQLLYGTKWKDLDFLIVDMPPGTGDIHLTLAKKYNINGVLLVTTPQEMAVADVDRAADMYKKLEIPILGVIENMSYLKSKGGVKVNLWKGNLGIQNLVEKYRVDIVTKIPLDPLLNIEKFIQKIADILA